MDIIDRIFETMKRKGITQGTLANALNIQQSAISHWKGRGSKIYLEQIPIICEVLDISPNYLINGDELPISISSNEMDIIEQVRKIHPESQKDIIDFIEYKLYKQESTPK